MPQRRKYYKKKGRRTNKSRGANDKQVTFWSEHSVLEKANRALAIGQQIKRFINVEVKHHDNVFSPTNVTTTPIVVNLTAILQGDSNTQRNGTSIKPLGLTLRGAVSRNSAGGSQLLRLMIVNAKQQNGAHPLAAELLEDPANPLTPKNYDDRYRSKVLYDRLFVLDGANQHELAFTISEKLFGHVTYDGTASIPETGGIYLVALSDEDTNPPTIQWYNRVTFTDN